MEPKILFTVSPFPPSSSRSMKLSLLSLWALSLQILLLIATVQSLPIDTDLVSSPFIHQLNMKKGRVGTIRPQNVRLEQ
jgi:hypothetical protein